MGGRKQSFDFLKLPLSQEMKGERYQRHNKRLQIKQMKIYEFIHLKIVCWNSYKEQ